MNSKLRSISILLCLLSTAWIAFTAIFIPLPATSNTRAARQGFLAPDVNLPTMDGSSLQLSELRGQIVLINFWASWCPPCKAEMPDLQSIYTEYKDQGFTLLAINLTSGDNQDSAKAYVLENQYNFPVLFDLNGSVNNLYNVRAVPTSYLVDEHGIIQAVIIGRESEAAIKARIDALLQKRP